MAATFKQAKHDALCGFYSALNALRLLQTHEPQAMKLPRDNQTLFNDAVDLLAKMKGVTARIIHGDEGLEEGHIAELCNKLKKKYGLPVSVLPVSKVYPSAESFRDIEEYAATVSGRRPFAIVALCDAGRHWTVVGAHKTQGPLRLDSDKEDGGRADGRVTRHFEHDEGVIIHRN